MRFIHTSDWHLGRFFFGLHLTADQEYLLKEQFIPLIKDTKPDILLISGDLYDRGVPPLEAVALLDEVLYKIIAELKVPVVIISGNHDSGERLAFASRFLSEQKLFVFGGFNPDIDSVTISDSYGAINIYPLPYTEPVTVRDALSDKNITDHNSAVSEVLNIIKRKHPSTNRAIVMAHVFTIGGETCESERPLSSSSFAGGIDTVNTSLFNAFHYTALGHLHRAQTIGSNKVRYSGSLMKYSFSEANHVKSVELVDMDRDGNCTSERIPLTPKRDLRQITGFLKDILSNENRSDDYLEVTLLDEGALLNPMEKLREKYPNVLKIERPMLMRADSKFSNNRDHKKATKSELFSCFFKEVENKDLNDEQKIVFNEILDNINKDNQ
ncbi:MAG: exonuclease SbcCD subunit D [Nitrospirae bacterium]|nr:exonuclease SbcCD subunit D [Nitrospirota bacterium]MBF0535024.1 exonuclease SbcCD subunit D [Nitrospirota bacterium]MBF0616532.1 exonuclease SbcCD subunit D [Nitrospirota bacterium]